MRANCTFKFKFHWDLYICGHKKHLLFSFFSAQEKPDTEEITEQLARYYKKKGHEWVNTLAQDNIDKKRWGIKRGKTNAGAIIIKKGFLNES